jgi:ubiquinol-cytochrome c reductase cytochrome c1 subunit
MKKLAHLIYVVAVLFTTNAIAAGGGGTIFHMNPDVGNEKSLQRGAAYFVNYCMSCHSAEFSRYKRVAEDLGISEQNMLDNMIFTGRKYGDTMTVAMDSEQAKQWLGAAPPDLSVRARARGADWIYSFLKSFYLDSSSNRGINNKMLAGTSMPHVLWELQGYQMLNEDFEALTDSEIASLGPDSAELVKEIGTDKAVDHDQDGQHGADDHSPFTLVVKGKLTPEEYDQFVTDIVNFMVYMAEPAQLSRKTIGTGVLFFLAALFVLVYFMKRDYWKDVH